MVRLEFIPSIYKQRNGNRDRQANICSCTGSHSIAGFASQPAGLYGKLMNAYTYQSMRIKVIFDFLSPVIKVTNFPRIGLLRQKTSICRFWGLPLFWSTNNCSFFCVTFLKEC
jgi:hypothetical protein